MKEFLKYILLYVILLGMVVSIYILIVYLRPDFVDNFYYRFTTDRSHSLILGGSRAAQGIKPDVLNKTICHEKNKIINHSFALGPSNFGPNYLKEVKQKLVPESKDGLFIISVVPWNFATDITNTEDDSLLFFEVRQELFVGNLESSSSNPNFEYLWKYWFDKFSVFELAFKHMIGYKGILQLHADGWLEVNISMDSIAVNNRIRNSSNGYKEKASYVKWSNTRYHYFEKMVDYLKNRGNVYIVRLPVSENMAELEKEKFPDFDKYIAYVANEYNIEYFNFINESGQFRTTDTHHLWKQEAERISYRISDSILVANDRRFLMAN